MARTPLTRALRRMAGEHRAADVLGCSPEQVHDAEPGWVRREISRRTLLQGAVGTAGALALATAPLRPERAAAATAPRIAIVGAGISGLCAALRLQDSGVASTVYEANTRIGGRMYSNTTTWSAGQVSEWGGELIDTGHKTIQTLAKRFNLPLDDLVQAEPNSAQPTYSFGGRYYPYAQATSDFSAVHQAVQRDMQSFTWPVVWNSSTPGGVALSNLSLYDWIESRVPGGHGSSMGQLLDVAYNIEYGGETSDQTALNLLGLLGYQPQPGQFSMFGLSDERYHIRGGNQQLPLAIAAALPARSVVTGWQLTGVVANADGTQTLSFLVGRAKQTVTADHTILTVPLGVLQRLDLSHAGLDQRKQGQISSMRMGKNVKLQLQFGHRVWNSTGPWPGISTGETYADTGYQNTWDVSRAQPGTPGILVNYTGGVAAGSYAPPVPFSDQSSAYVRSAAATFLSQVEPVLPGLTGEWNGRATLSAWPTNPYSYGAYSYWPTGYCHRYAGYEGMRQGNLHFAGEHCSIDFQGYMEGGADEGQRAAGEILGDLGLK
ncbi:MAG: flavin monoamine oxidase family protein [Blastococcus sp.]